MPGMICSRAHQSLLTLLPSIWWPAVAAPHRKCSGKVLIFGPFGRWVQWSVGGGESRGRMPQAALFAERTGSARHGGAVGEHDARCRGGGNVAGDLDLVALDAPLDPDGAPRAL